MDQLAPLFARFSLSARVFHTGALCGPVDLDNSHGIGILHVLRRGRVRVVLPGVPSFEVAQPSLLFFRRAEPHRFEATEADGADLVCAHIDFGSEFANPLLRGMPGRLVVPLAQMTGVEATLVLLFGEAFEQRAGREAAIDRLVEYFVVLLLRHAIEGSLIGAGVLAALADPRLAKAMMAMHAHPEHDWSLPALASTAGMSRAQFALHFHNTVDATPLDYLTDWRISIAQSLLRRGKPLKMVAPAVGYGSAESFSRVFTRRVGLTPSGWLAR